MIESAPSVSDVLEVVDLSKRYAVTVLDRVQLQVRAGEIHALLGANGAGKSTLCKIVAGLIPATSGSMLLGGKPFSPTTKQHAESAGVQIVQQELELIPTLTVAENLYFGRMPASLGVVRRRELNQRARAALDRFGLTEISTEQKVESLGVGRQQMVEIAKALDRDCRLLILDEPTAALSSAETQTLFKWLRRLREAGVGLIYISHRLEEVAGIADRLTVLRDGRCVCTRETSDVTTDEMVELMSGDSDAIDAEKEQHNSFAIDEFAMRVDSMSNDAIHDVSLNLRRGERLGIAGLVGSGRTELLRAIFGADPCHRGYVQLGDSETKLRFLHPSEAVAAGVAMVTEDRKRNGLLLSQSIRTNTTLNSLRQQFARWGILRGVKEASVARAMCDTMETRCTNIEQTVETLSGGNQQKVAVSKWLVRDADVFLFDEPTRGIDVAARRRIYAVLESLAKAGKGIVIVSSDLEELYEICDRISVMAGGILVQTFARGEWSEEAIMHAAFSNSTAADAYFGDEDGRS